MALYSTGGGSYPDVLISSGLVALFIISLLTNPFVFRHNLKKHITAASLLFTVLAMFDLLTGICMPALSVYYLTKREDPSCSISKSDESTMDCIRGIELLPFQRFSVVVQDGLILGSNAVAALLTICRFIQIKLPFYPVRVSRIAQVFVFFMIYSTTIEALFCYADEGVYFISPIFSIASFEVSIGPNLKVSDETAIFCMRYGALAICQIFSIAATIGTLIHMYKVSKKPVITVARSELSRSLKISMKIMVTNLGALATTGCMAYTREVCQSIEHLDTIWRLGRNECYFMTFFWIILPVLLSCYNPVVFICFTSGIYRWSQD